MKEASIGRERPSPTLKTVVMVENVIADARGVAVSVADIKRSVPKKVNHCTLVVVLEYLERTGRVKATLRGVAWTGRVLGQ